MSEKIADGRGSGKLLEITNDHRANVSSKTSRRIYYASRDLKSAYTVNWMFQSVGPTGTAGYLSYSGSKNLFIDRVFVSTEEDADAITKFGLWADSTVSGGAVRIPKNMNLTSALTPDVSSYHDFDSANTITESVAGDSVGTVRLMGADTFEWVFDGAVIMGYGNTFSVKAAVSSGKKARVTIQFWEEEI